MISDLERKIIRVLSSRGPQDAIQLAMDVNIFLSADYAADKQFFDMLEILENRGAIEWYRTTNEKPAMISNEESFPYVSRVYGMRL